MSTPAKQAPQKQYFSNGQSLSAPPLTARLRTLLDDAYAFAGLYLTTLFSTDAYEAAQNSPFSTQGRNAVRGGARASTWTSGRSTGGSGGSAGRGGGSGGFGSGFGFNMGGADHVRTPGCGSCG